MNSPAYTDTAGTILSLSEVNSRLYVILDLADGIDSLVSRHTDGWATETKPVLRSASVCAKAIREEAIALLADGPATTGVES